MASSSTLFLFSLLLIFLLFAESSNVIDPHKSTSTEDVPSSLQKSGIDCGGSCAFRCSKSSRPNLCKRACGTCCSRCNCVPPGTSGNRQVCPCYASLTTRNGQLKCP